MPHVLGDFAQRWTPGRPCGPGHTLLPYGIHCLPEVRHFSPAVREGDSTDPHLEVSVTPFRRRTSPNSAGAKCPSNVQRRRGSLRPSPSNKSAAHAAGRRRSAVGGAEPDAHSRPTREQHSATLRCRVLLRRRQRDRSTGKAAGAAVPTACRFLRLGCLASPAAYPARAVTELPGGVGLSRGRGGGLTANSCLLKRHGPHAWFPPATLRTAVYGGEGGSQPEAVRDRAFGRPASVFWDHLARL
jgi:hypothetical protein